MRCLILAAGRGSRLSKEGAPKPLLSVVGLPLIERTILTAQRAGLRDFCVITGYEGERIGDFLADLSRRRNLKIAVIQNDEWADKGNGVSVLRAEEFFSENFILLMGDHIFEEATLIGLMKEAVADDEILLAADFNTRNSKLVEARDVTKVSVEDDTILDIGKDLEGYHAYDTGMFLCSPAIFGAVKESSRNGDTSLSGAVRIMAREGNARVFNIEGRYWMDVDTPTDRKKAHKLLYATLGKPHDGWISRRINRIFSTRVFTPLILKLYHKATPNQVSLATALVGVMASLCFFFHLAVIGGVLIQLASILDGSDGEIARLKKMQSPFGNFLDAVLDRYVDSFILFGIFYYSFTATELSNLLGPYRNPLVLATAILAISGNVMVSYTSAKSIADFGYRYRGGWIAAGRGRDLRQFLLFGGGVLTWVHPVSVFLAILVVAVLTNAIVLRRLAVSRSYEQSRNPLLGLRLKAVVFDFDGTLANTMPFLTDLAVNLIEDNYEISKEAAHRRYRETTGMDFAAQMEEIFPSHPKNRDVVAAFEASKREGVLDHPPFAEVIPTLRFLKNRNIKRFICSSTKPDIIADYATRYEINDWVDGCLGYEPGFEKDRQLGSILEQHGLEPEEVILVGDSLRDGDFAEHKGVQFIGIRRIFDERAFQQRGLSSVEDLTALTRLWEQSEELLRLVEKAA